MWRCFSFKQGLVWLTIGLVWVNQAACDRAGKPDAREVESFEAFWERFFRDRNFQMSRVLFPLPERLPDETDWAAADSLPEGRELIRYWHPANWPYLQPPAPPSDSLRHLVERTDTTYRLRVGIPDADAFAELRFRRIEGRWYLIYFFSNL